MACRADDDDAGGSRTADPAVGAAAEKAAGNDQDGASHAGDWAPVLPGPVRPRRAGDCRNRPGLPRLGARFEFFAMVEAAGVEPDPRVSLNC